MRNLKHVFLQKILTFISDSNLSGKDVIPYVLAEVYLGDSLSKAVSVKITGTISLGPIYSLKRLLKKCISILEITAKGLGDVCWG